MTDLLERYRQTLINRINPPPQPSFKIEEGNEIIQAGGGLD